MNSRLEKAEEQFSVLEDKIMASSETEQKKEELQNMKTDQGTQWPHQT